MSDELREKLAEYAHGAWSGWLKYMFSKGTFNGTWTMPDWAVTRWSRQMSTTYADLPENEKESDLAEADKILAIAMPIFEDKILDIISEFGDDPVQCLQIICEDIQLRQHYRAYPNAPRVEEPL
jgi:hypothetical protein